jgi:hypothetical protein
LYYFYNKSVGGDIGKLVLANSFTDDWGSSTDAALEKAPHPVAKKEDIMVFGNGRYLGVYIKGTPSLDVQKLDFGEGTEVADVAFYANNWFIAINYGTNRVRSQIYNYAGSAISNLLTDEIGVGIQEIGFIMVDQGTVYVCYKDTSSTGFAIGYVSGRTIKPLKYFSGTMPDYRQKTFYKNTIMFVSDQNICSIGSPIGQIPIQSSNFAKAKYANATAIACPFGLPIVASSYGLTINGFKNIKTLGYSIGN